MLSCIKKNWYFFFWLGEVGGSDSDNKEDFKEKKKRLNTKNSRIVVKF